MWPRCKEGFPTSKDLKVDHLTSNDLVNKTPLSQVVVVHAFNPNSWKAERQTDLWVWGQPGLQSEMQDSQDYKEKPSSETKQNKNKKKIPQVYLATWVSVSSRCSQVDNQE